MRFFIPQRQLERLFHGNLNCTPTHYYLGLQLRNARRLLLQTEKVIIDLSLVCGFLSESYFSKCYKDLFGLSPRGKRHLMVTRGESVQQE